MTDVGLQNPAWRTTVELAGKHDRATALKHWSHTVMMSTNQSVSEVPSSLEATASKDG